MRTLSSALAITAILACARGQAPPPTAGGWVDPNRQVLGLTAALTVDDVDGNPVGLVPVSHGSARSCGKLLRVPCLSAEQRPCRSPVPQGQARDELVARGS